MKAFSRTTKARAKPRKSITSPQTKDFILFTTGFATSRRETTLRRIIQLARLIRIKLSFLLRTKSKGTRNVIKKIKCANRWKSAPPKRNQSFPPCPAQLKKRSFSLHSPPIFKPYHRRSLKVTRPRTMSFYFQTGSRQ